MPYTANSVTKMGLAASAGAVKEQYIPLIIYSSSTIQTTNYNAGTTFVAKGTSTVNGNGTSSSAVKLHTLNTSWSLAQKFAFEVSLYSGGGYNAFARLWDVTAGGAVIASQVTTTATTTSVVRSSSFTLIPGHVYAIDFWTNNTAGYCNLTKAHLVAIN